MSDLFLRRMANKGNHVGEAIKLQSDVIMDKTFFNDPHTRPVRVYHAYKSIDVKTYAKYQRSSRFSILKDQVDYHLQFRSKEHYPIGCYVDLPNDVGEIETWLIVGKDDSPQFVRYSILQINREIKWIVDGVIYTSPCVLRTRNSYNSGIWNDGFVTTVENQNSFWVQTNPITQTIYYDTRFLISDSQIHPISYFVTKVEDTFPSGITKIVLKQDLFNPERDNAELMIANYYLSKIEPVDSSKDDNLSTSVEARIDISTWKSPKLIIGTDYRELTGGFYRGNNEIQMNGIWRFDTDADIYNKFSIVQEANKLLIKCDKDYSLVGKIVTVSLSDESNTYTTSQRIEVAAR